MQSLIILTSALLTFIGTLVTIKHWYYIEKNVQCHASSTTKADFQHGVNYQLETDKFLATISNCIQDSKCHIQYLHTSKTGGTTIEGIFQSIFPSNKVNSCCSQTMMERFRNDIPDHCVKEFNSYQVTGHNFGEIVRKCLVEYKKLESTTTNSLVKDDNTSHRMVVLATFREPIQQSLSGIHQLCNKNFNTRWPALQEACNNCSYEKDTEFWDHHVTEINEKFESLYNHVILKVEKYERVELLTIDNMDITPFFTKLVDRLPPPYSTRLEERLQEKGVYNPEVLWKCDFGYHSAMMKNHASSIAIYRNMTLGH